MVDQKIMPHILFILLSIPNSKNCKEVLVTFFFYKGLEGFGKTVESKLFFRYNCVCFLVLGKAASKCPVPDIGGMHEEYHIIL